MTAAFGLEKVKTPESTKVYQNHRKIKGAGKKERKRIGSRRDETEELRGEERTCSESTSCTERKLQPVY